MASHRVSTAVASGPLPPSVDRTRQGSRAGFRPDLQGLRGVAVLGVVVYHLRASWLPGGFAGVDVFFVLSGFFITGLLLHEIDRHRRVGLRAFWGRRARRLLPASMLVLVSTVVAGRLMTNPLEAQRIARDGLFAAVFGVNWREAASGVSYGQDPDPSPFQHYWSLGVEEQFYLVWPLLLVALTLAWRWRRSWSPRRTLIAVSIPLGLVSFLLALHQTASDQPYAYYGTFGRIWQLALGGVLAVMVTWTGAPPRWFQITSRLVGIGVIVGFYVAAPDVTTYPGLWSLLPTAGAAAVVMAGASTTRREPVASLLGSRLGQLGGRYSYSWYLWHWPPLVLLPIALDRPLRIRELGLCAVGTFLAAILTFHLLEDPVRRSRWLGKGRGGRSLLLGAVLMIVGVAVSLSAGVAAQRATTGSHIVTPTRQRLTPQPAQAAAERAAVSGDGCQLPMTSPGFAPQCRYLPDTGHGDVVLVGDSHAGMWFPPLDQIAKSHGWGLRVWARTSCPFADVQKSVSGRAEYVNCDRWRANVIQRLITDRPSLVIVTSYAQSSLHVTDPRTGGGATQARAHQLFQVGMERNLARLRAAGLHVLLIGDVPAYTQAGPDCALTHPSDLALCSLPQGLARPDGGVDVSAARGVRGVHIADFTRHFCHGGRCYQVVGHILGYRDINHLTTEMAVHLAPELDADAAAAIR